MEKIGELKNEKGKKGLNPQKNGEKGGGTWVDKEGVYLYYKEEHLLERSYVN